MVSQTNLEVLESAYPLQEEEELGPEKKGYLMNYLILAMPKRALIRRETGLRFYACCRKQRDDCGGFSD